MPNLPIQQLIPPYPLHWTTILHYIILLGAITLLTIGGDKTSLLFTFILAGLAVLTGISLYSTLIQIPRIAIFLIRVGIFGLPVVIAGMSDTDEGRVVGIGLGMLGLVILAVLFVTCWFGTSFGDPRIYQWC